MTDVVASFWNWLTAGTNWSLAFSVVIVAMWGGTLYWAIAYRSSDNKPTKRAYAYVLLFATVYCYLSELTIVHLGKYSYGDLPMMIAFPEPVVQFVKGHFAGAVQATCQPHTGIPFPVVAMEGLLLLAIMRTTNHLYPKWWVKPFLDGLIALNIDLLLDPVVAISRPCGAGGVAGDVTHQGLGLWTWYTEKSYQAFWFGVPAANFLGWFVNAVVFMFAIRLVLGFLERRDWGLPGQGVALLLALVLALAFEFGFLTILGGTLTWSEIKEWHATVLIGIVGLSLLIILTRMENFSSEEPFRRQDWMVVGPQVFIFLYCVLAVARPPILGGTVSYSGWILWAVLPISLAFGLRIALAPYWKTLSTRQFTIGKRTVGPIRPAQLLSDVLDSPTARPGRPPTPPRPRRDTPGG